MDLERLLWQELGLTRALVNPICAAFLATRPTFSDADEDVEMSSEHGDSEDDEVDPDGASELSRSSRTAEVDGRVIEEQSSPATLLAPDEAYILVMLTICRRLCSLTLMGSLSVLKHMSYLQAMLEYASHDFVNTGSNGSRVPGEAASPDLGIYNVSKIILEHTSAMHGGLVVQDLEVLLHFPAMKYLRTNTFWKSGSNFASFLTSLSCDRPRARIILSSHLGLDVVAKDSAT